MTPDYRAHISSSMNNDFADTINDVARNITQSHRMEALGSITDDDINPVVDAQLDRIIAACGGDTKLALCSLVVTYGTAMRIFTGIE
jgi:hypothetical protein